MFGGFFLARCRVETLKQQANVHAATIERTGPLYFVALFNGVYVAFVKAPKVNDARLRTQGGN